MVLMNFEELTTVAQKLENMVPIEDVDHEALWLALLIEVRQPGAHAPICTAIEWR